MNKKSRLVTDASGVALGAILAQVDDQNNEYACAYASRLLKDHEQHYSITELECLVVVWSVHYFSHYLINRRFEIVTDHLALVWLFKHEDPNSRRMRWKAAL